MITKSNHLQKLASLLVFVFLTNGMTAQTHTLTLSQCYTLAREHYPMTRQLDLVRQTGSYTVDNIAKGLLPQAGLYAQATYQSDVTQVPITVPGMEIPVISKDQYRLYAEATHTLYDGGVNRQQQRVASARHKMEEQKTEVELYTVNERIQQLFFSILLLDQQAQQLVLVSNDIATGINTVNAAITHGTALRSQAAVLEAEKLKTEQRRIEVTSARKAAATMLAHMTGIPPEDSILLVKPEPVIALPDILRPELVLMDRQEQQLSAQEELLHVKNRPKVSLFLQGGIGRPALNMLDNDIKGYYLGGVRAAWPISGYYTMKNDRVLLDIQRQTIDVQRETFLFNLRLQQQQQDQAIQKWNALLQTDEAILALRREIKQTALAQMELGVITSHDYLREVNAEDQARQNQLIHETQWLMAQYALQYITGQHD